MSVQHQLLLLLGLTAVLHTADARGHHGLHGHHHLASAPSPQALPVFHHGHHILGHGHHHHGIAEAPKANPVSNALLEEKCKLTNNPEVCLTVARHYAHAYPTIDNVAILDMLITAAIDGSRSAATESAKVVADLETPALVAKNLKECSGGFKDAVDNLNHVKDAVVKRDHGTVLTYLSAALDNVGRCTDVFEERPTAEKNPLAADSKLLADITSASLGFAYVAFGIPH